MMINSPENEVVFARVNVHKFQRKICGQTVLCQKVLNTERTIFAKLRGGDSRRLSNKKTGTFCL